MWSKPTKEKNRHRASYLRLRVALSLSYPGLVYAPFSEAPSLTQNLEIETAKIRALRFDTDQHLPPTSTLRRSSVRWRPKPQARRMATFHSSLLLQLCYEDQSAIVVFRPLGMRILHDTEPARYIPQPIVIRMKASAFIVRLLTSGS